MLKIELICSTFGLHALYDLHRRFDCYTPIFSSKPNLQEPSKLLHDQDLRNSRNACAVGLGSCICIPAFSPGLTSSPLSCLVSSNIIIFPKTQPVTMSLRQFCHCLLSNLVKQLRFNVTTRLLALSLDSPLIMLALFSTPSLCVCLYLLYLWVYAGWL